MTKSKFAYMPYEFVRILIPSPTAVQKWGNKDYAQHAIGTGPFKIDEYVDGQVMELSRNEEYWSNRQARQAHPLPDARAGNAPGGPAVGRDRLGGSPAARSTNC